MKRLLCFSLFLLFISFPAYSTPGLSTSEVNVILQLASSVHKQAIENEGGWKITERYIKKAKKYLAEGKRREALKAANKAREYAELSNKQAITQKTNWSEPPYLK